MDLKYWILYESIYYFDRVWSAEKEICNGWGVQLIILNIGINFIGPKVYMRYAFFFIVSIPLLIGFMKKEREKKITTIITKKTKGKEEQVESQITKNHHYINFNIIYNMFFVGRVFDRIIIL